MEELFNLVAVSGKLQVNSCVLLKRRFKIHMLDLCLIDGNLPLPSSCSTLGPDFSRCWKSTQKTAQEGPRTSTSWNADFVDLSLKKNCLSGFHSVQN